MMKLGHAPPAAEIVMQPVELFRFCPRCGSVRPPEYVGAVPLRCDACRLIFFFNPTVAAAALIEDAAGRVLFVRRAKEPSLGMLGVPGGFVDFGESAEEGVRREVREEIGIEISRLTFLASFPNLYPYREVSYPVVDLYFRAVAVDQEAARPLDGVTAIEWRWPREVREDEIAFSSLRQALRLMK